MPGLYLLAILLSAAMVIALDLRFGLTIRRAPLRTLLSVASGIAILLAIDLVAIANGIFMQGDSPLYLGIRLAPHLPIEEVFFLAFLCYLALVSADAGARLLTRGKKRL